MSHDKFDTDMPKIVLEKEDREAFQRTRQNTGSKRPTAPASDDTPKQKSGASSFFVFLVFLIAAGASGASYWLYEKKKLQDALIANSEQRILDLERRLSATGEEMDQSAVALQVKVTELSEKTSTLWSEMDKLWASAWRKNQSEIKAMDKRLNDQFAQGRDLSKQFSSLQSDVISSTTNMALIQEQVDAGSSERANLTMSLQEIALGANGLKQEIEELQTKLSNIERVNNDVSRRIVELEKWRLTVPKRQRPEPIDVGVPPSQPTGSNE